MDGSAYVDFTPTASEMVQSSPDRRAWSGEPGRINRWYVTDTETELRAGREPAGSRAYLFDVHASTPVASGTAEKSVMTQFSGGIARAAKAHSVSAEVMITTHTVRNRTKLLAMKYAASEPAPELLARLEILNARLGRLMPRVERSVWESIDSDLAAMNQLSSELDDLLSTI